MAASGKSSGLDLTRLRTKRVSTGSVAANGSAVVTVTWDTPFADVNYTATVDVAEASAEALGMTVVKIESRTAAAITVRVRNENAVSARTGTLYAIGIHD